MRDNDYLRNYASTVRMLAERGHQVIVGSRAPERHIAVDMPRFLEALSRDPPAVGTIKFPRRGDEWAPLLHGVQRSRLRVTGPRATFAAFLTSFRPQGMDLPSTPRLADAVEAMQELKLLPAPHSAPAHLVARTARAVLVANAESHRQAAQ